MTMNAKRSAGGRHSAARRRPGVLGVLSLPLVLLSIALSLVGGTTLAMWWSGALSQGGTITAGDLNLTVGQMSWQQVTPGVTDPASGSLASSPPGFVSMPGDIVQIRVPVTTFLKGDNIAADLTVDYSAPPSADDITVTYHLEDSTGSQVAPASGDVPISSSLTLPTLAGDNAGVTAQWTVVLSVQVLGDYRWITPQNAAASTDWHAGTVLVTLDQVRSATADAGGAS
jgi:alternate signal-mediated exported protein